MTPALTRLDLVADAERWRAAAFTVESDELVIGTVAVRFVTGERHGLVGWHLDGDLPTAGPAHPNGAFEIDHVVLMTPDLDDTVADLAGQGFDARRTRDAGPGVTQVFFRFANGPILEVVGPVASPFPHLWGLVLNTHDLDATLALLGPERVGAAKDAVQPGRRIATVTKEAELGAAVAFMSSVDPPSGGHAATVQSQ